MSSFKKHEILALQLLGCQTSHIIKYNRIAQETDWDNDDMFWAEFLQDNIDYFADSEENVLNSALSKARRIMQEQNNQSIRTISFLDKEYPQSFKKLGNESPALIYLLGNEELLSQENQVAIIGARHADHQGCANAYKLGELYGASRVVISGLAAGCDTAAHQGCLKVKGKTTAIVATGLERVHPEENKFLQKNILDNGGLVLSEQPWGTNARGKNLVARNRLQAALAETIIVAQCLLNSGTMYTVQFGKKYGKKICAVQEKPNEYNSGNCFLIESGQAEAIVL